MDILGITIAIAFLLLVIWLLLQPKQGSQASNALDSSVPDGQDQTQPSAAAVPAPPISPNPEEKTAAGLSQPPPATPQVPPDFDSEIYQLLNSEQTVAAIKRVQQVKNWGLQESTDYVGTLMRQQPPPEIQERVDQLLNAPAPHLTASPELRQEVYELLAAQRKVTAVKRVKEVTGWHLWEAKKYVDTIQAEEYQPAIQAALENLDPEIKQEVRRLVDSMYKGMAIKRLRDATGCPLKDAMDYIDRL